MYRFLFKPKWLGFHLLVLALIVIMVNLGFWQKHRLEDRREFNAEVRARSSEPIVPIEEVVTDATDPADVQWRTVTATGTYLPDEQVVIVNRAQGGVTGVNVVAPLELDDGRLVLINRGFVPDAESVPAPATGVVEVTGRLRETQERTLGGLTEADGELTELFRVDIPRLAEQLPAPVLSVYVDLLAAEPDQGALPIPLPAPELSEGSHLSYMMQWWIFSACAAAGWVLAVRRSIRQHRTDVAAAATGAGAGAGVGVVSEPDGRTPPDSLSPDDDAATTAHG
jgi:cytochrome oxidase assembly protein ShyY1